MANKADNKANKAGKAKAAGRKAGAGKGRAPSIWAYRDARLFTAEQVDWLKTRDKRLSFRQLSLAANLGSPNYIQQFIQGERNIKRETAHSLAVALQLRGTEQAYFAALVKFTQLPTGADQLAAYQDVLRISARSGRAATLDASRMRYFTDWYIPVIHAMASLKSFRASPDWIARQVVPPIKPSQAQAALEILEELGILAFPAKGRAEVREPQLETDAGLQGLWVREYHRAMIRLSERALDEIAPSDRTTAALTVTVPHHMVTEVLDRVDRYRHELFDELMQRQEQPDQDEATDGIVMQINFQAYPLMEPKK